MGKPVIVAAMRTPFGRRQGALAHCHASYLLAHLQKAILDSVDLDPSEVDQVVGGCATAAGEQSFNITRMAWLSAGLPVEVGAVTIDCQCGSSLQANGIVQSMIAAGAIDVGMACGVEVMSRVGIGANTRGPGRVQPVDFPYDMPNQFVAAERIAAKWGVSRDELDELGLASQCRAARARERGWLAEEIAPVDMPCHEGQERSRWRTIAEDEGIRPSSRDGLAALQPIRPGGLHTAATTSQISDGAGAVLWMDAQRAASLGIPPLARIRAQVLVGTDPYLHIAGPIDATAAVLRRAGMSIADVDRFEINEAFAAVVLAWQRTYGVDPDRLNPNGGAIALGHPMGATGCRLVAAAIRELQRSNRSTALLSMCCGSAVAPAVVLERI